MSPAGEFAGSVTVKAMEAWRGAGAVDASYATWIACGEAKSLGSGAVTMRVDASYAGALGAPSIAADVGAAAMPWTRRIVGCAGGTYDPVRAVVFNVRPSAATAS